MLKGSEGWVEGWADVIYWRGVSTDSSSSDRCESVVSAEPKREEGRGEILRAEGGQEMCPHTHIPKIEAQLRYFHARRGGGERAIAQPVAVTSRGCLPSSCCCCCLGVS
jgi:hypothetical protein